MRPAIMLLLRALMVMAAILAVLSCNAAGVTTSRARFESLDAGKYSWQSVPAAGGTFANSGTGTRYSAITSHSRREA